MGRDQRMLQKCLTSICSYPDETARLCCYDMNWRYYIHVSLVRFYQQIIVTSLWFHWLIPSWNKMEESCFPLLMMLQQSPSLLKIEQLPFEIHCFWGPQRVRQRCSTWIGDWCSQGLGTSAGYFRVYGANPLSGQKVTRMPSSRSRGALDVFIIYDACIHYITWAGKFKDSHYAFIGTWDH